MNLQLAGIQHRQQSLWEVQEPGGSAHASVECRLAAALRSTGVGLHSMTAAHAARGGPGPGSQGTHRKGSVRGRGRPGPWLAGWGLLVPAMPAGLGLVRAAAMCRQARKSEPSTEEPPSHFPAVNPKTAWPGRSQAQFRLAGCWDAELEFSSHT